MSEYSKKLRDAYEAEKGLYEQFTRKNEQLIREILKEGEDFHAIESRTKDLDSFEAKIDSPEKEQKYKNVCDITDLSGMRIICYLKGDVDRVCENLAKIYKMDIENSTNKDDKLEPDQFGYLSRHFVVQYTDERASLPENKPFSGLKAEIQVRTILQHAWAAIDWKLRYKSSSEIPKKLRRRVFRVSALLELVDDEFLSLSNSASDLRQSYESDIQSGNFEIGIDGESAELFLNNSEPLNTLTEIAKEIGFSISPNAPGARTPYGSLIDTANSAKLTIIDHINTKIDESTKNGSSRLRDVFKEWKKVPGHPPRLVIPKAGLARLALILSLEKPDALRVISEVPFGPRLQDAVKATLEH